MWCASPWLRLNVKYESSRCRNHVSPQQDKTNTENYWQTHSYLAQLWCTSWNNERVNMGEIFAKLSVALQLRCSAALTGTHLDVFSQQLNHYFLLFRRLMLLRRFLSFGNIKIVITCRKFKSKTISQMISFLRVTLMSKAFGEPSDLGASHCTGSSDSFLVK